ncbi:MAG: phage BR0599 family protein [Bacteroidales bacterium]|nr:phage BR0599 family protein [Bacteroidales bacterium]
MSRNIADAIKPELYKLYTRPYQIAKLYLESPYTDPSHFYVANTQDITFAGQVYTALAVKRTGIKSEEGTILQELTISLDNVDLSFRTLIASGAFNRKRCILGIVFHGFLTNASNMITVFDGYMDAPSGDDHWVNIQVKPFPIFEREYPRRIFQVGCNWTFGDAYCGMILGDYDASLTTLAGSSTTVLNFTDGGYDSDYFVPGYVEITSGTLEGEVRPIISSTSSSVTLRIPLSNTPDEGTTFTVQKICKKNPTACQDDFDNYLSYGGFPHVPIQPVI